MATKKRREYWTTAEVADVLGVHVTFVTSLARKGEIPAYRYGKLWRYDPKAILEYAANKAQQEYNRRKGA